MLKYLKAKTQKKDRHWTLLIVGNRGKTYTIKRFKGLAITLASVLIIAIAASTWLGSLYKSSIVTNKSMQNNLKNSQQKIMSLEHEKDILMARLVVAESRIEESVAGTKVTDVQKPFDNNILNSSASDKKGTSSQLETPLSVSADDFIVFHEPDINTLRVQYKLRNTGSKASPVSGRTVVILKNKGDDKKKWLTLPNVSLISGKPSGKRGRTFSIYKFRTMKFRASDQTGPDQFNIATVFVFSTAGKLILEKDFPIGVKFKTLSTSLKKKPKPSPPVKKKPAVSAPKEKKPAGSHQKDKKPEVSSQEKKEVPHSLQTEKKPAASPQVEITENSAASEETIPKEINKKLPPPVESNDKTSTSKETDELINISVE